MTRGSGSKAPDFELVRLLQPFIGMKNEWPIVDVDTLGGTNFLVSAIHSLRRQRSSLEGEVTQLRERLKILEEQNAAFMNLSADRLLDAAHR